MSPAEGITSSTAARSAGFGATLRLGELRTTPNDLVLGQLARTASESGLHSLIHDQTDAWIAELNLLRLAASRLADRLPASQNWELVLEFEIPRSG